MAKSMVCVTIETEFLEKVDKWVYEERVKTRSALIEMALRRYLNEPAPEPSKRQTAEDRRESRALDLVNRIHKAGFRFFCGKPCIEDPVNGNTCDLLRMIGATEYSWYIKNWHFVHLKAEELLGKYISLS